MLNICRIIFPSTLHTVINNNCLRFTISLSAESVVFGSKMSYSEGSRLSERDLYNYIKQCIPKLDNSKHKGEAGRIGIVGGSMDYTGAPYFAAISALKVGADLAHVFCTQAAAPVIKSYSPELIVHPILDSEESGTIRDQFTPWLDRLHALVIGPGLGRSNTVLAEVTEIIQMCSSQQKPIIIDADGLFLITESIHLVRQYPLPGVILTPNKVEYERLLRKICKDDDENAIDFDKLGNNVYVLQKGATDNTYSKDQSKMWSLNLGGSGRRCGGQGDLLAGSMATFLTWAVRNFSQEPMLPAAIATYSASKLTRMCNERAFRIKGRSMVCSDMIEKIHEAFDEDFELRS